MTDARERDEQQRHAALVGELTARWPEQMIEPSLVRIASVVELLGDPQRAYPVIHVTGTNGKTTTARVIESLLRSFGLRTGLFTSPHLLDARERRVAVLKSFHIDRARLDRLTGAHDGLTVAETAQ